MKVWWKIVSLCVCVGCGWLYTACESPSSKEERPAAVSQPGRGQNVPHALASTPLPPLLHERARLQARQRGLQSELEALVENIRQAETRKTGLNEQISIADNAQRSRDIIRKGVVGDELRTIERRLVWLAQQIAEAQALAGQQRDGNR